MKDGGSGSSGGLAADTDNDGDVDGTDFLTWQQNYGNTGADLAGDFDNDGDVDEVDLAIWEEMFGTIEDQDGGLEPGTPERMPFLIAYVNAIMAFVGILPFGDGERVEYDPSIHEVGLTYTAETPQGTVTDVMFIDEMVRSYPGGDFILFHIPLWILMNYDRKNLTPGTVVTVSAAIYNKQASQDGNILLPPPTPIAETRSVTVVIPEPPKIIISRITEPDYTGTSWVCGRIENWNHSRSYTLTSTLHGEIQVNIDGYFSFRTRTSAFSEANAPELILSAWSETRHVVLDRITYNSSGAPNPLPTTIESPLAYTTRLEHYGNFHTRVHYSVEGRNYANVVLTEGANFVTDAAGNFTLGLGSPTLSQVSVLVTDVNNRMAAMFLNLQDGLTFYQITPDKFTIVMDGFNFLAIKSAMIYIIQPGQGFLDVVAGGTRENSVFAYEDTPIEFTLTDEDSVPVPPASIKHTELEPNNDGTELTQFGTRILGETQPYHYTPTRIDNFPGSPAAVDFIAWENTKKTGTQVIKINELPSSLGGRNPNALEIEFSDVYMQTRNDATENLIDFGTIEQSIQDYMESYRTALEQGTEPPGPEIITDLVHFNLIGFDSGTGAQLGSGPVFQTSEYATYVPLTGEIQILKTLYDANGHVTGFSVAVAFSGSAVTDGLNNSGANYEGTTSIIYQRAGIFLCDGSQSGELEFYPLPMAEGQMRNYGYLSVRQMLRYDEGGVGQYDITIEEQGRARRLATYDVNEYFTGPNGEITRYFSDLFLYDTDGEPVRYRRNGVASHHQIITNSDGTKSRTEQWLWGEGSKVGLEDYDYYITENSDTYFSNGLLASEVFNAQGTSVNYFSVILPDSEDYSPFSAVANQRELDYWLSMQSSSDWHQTTTLHYDYDTSDPSPDSSSLTHIDGERSEQYFTYHSNGAQASWLNRQRNYTRNPHQGQDNVSQTVEYTTFRPNWTTISYLKEHGSVEYATHTTGRPYAPFGALVPYDRSSFETIRERYDSDNMLTSSTTAAGNVNPLSGGGQEVIASYYDGVTFEQENVSATRQHGETTYCSTDGFCCRINSGLCSDTFVSDVEATFEKIELAAYAISAEVYGFTTRLFVYRPVVVYKWYHYLGFLDTIPVTLPLFGPPPSDGGAASGGGHDDDL